MSTATIAMAPTTVPPTMRRRRSRWARSRLGPLFGQPPLPGGFLLLFT